MRDVVYILKRDIDSDELRYSLRSVCENMEFREVWFFCGCPEWAQPDHHVPFIQKGTDGWVRQFETFGEIARTEGVSDEFYLFNDDFFVMKPYTMDGNEASGTLYGRALAIRDAYGQDTAYSKRLLYTAKMLQFKHLDRISYEVHMPMLMEKSKVAQTYEEFDNRVFFRSAYGNQHFIGGTIVRDVKVSASEPFDRDSALLSTNDKNFLTGAVGKFIRRQFPVKCRYER